MSILVEICILQLKRGREAHNGALEVSTRNRFTRAYEVTGQLIKSISDATDKLLDLQKKLKEVNTEEKQKEFHRQLIMHYLLGQQRQNLQKC